MEEGLSGKIFGGGYKRGDIWKRLKECRYLKRIEDMRYLEKVKEKIGWKRYKDLIGKG